MKTEEGKIKDAVKAYLKKRGAWYFMPVPVGYGVSTLDFLGCWNGKFFAIETKAPGSKLTPRQELTIKQLEEAGAIVFMIYSVRDTAFMNWFFR